MRLRRTKWIKDSDYPNLHNRRGVRWNRAPLPCQIHRCKPQSSGTYDRWHEMFDWCACGAKRHLGWLGRGRWYDKNARRRGEAA